jgi:hypothetical protein
MYGKQQKAPKYCGFIQILVTCYEKTNNKRLFTIKNANFLIRLIDLFCFYLLFKYTLRHKGAK